MIGLELSVPAVHSGGGSPSPPLASPSQSGYFAPPSAGAEVAVQQQKPAIQKAPDVELQPAKPAQPQAPVADQAPASQQAPAAKPAQAGDADVQTAPKPAVQQTNVESEMGIAPLQRTALRDNLGKPISAVSGGVLGQVWRSVTTPGQPGQLTLSNSRRLFNNQRGRFWRAVRANPQARQIIADMGGVFPPGPTTAPVITLPDGTQMQITVDHIVERQTAPGRALDDTNLRLSTRRENTVVLRQLHDQDPFQNPPPGWVPF